MSWIFSYLITHTSARLPPRTFVSLGTDRFTCSFIFAWRFITSDYETFCDGITFPIDPLLLIWLHLIELVSPFLLQVHWALVNPDDKWKDSFMRLPVHFKQPHHAANTKQKGTLMSLINTTWQPVTHSQTWCSCQARLPWVPLRDNIVQITVHSPTKRKWCQQLNYLKLKAKLCCTHSLPCFSSRSSLPLQRHCFLGEICILL